MTEDERNDLVLRLLRDLRDKADVLESQIGGVAREVEGLKLEVRGGIGPIHRELGAMHQLFAAFREDVNQLGIQWTLLEARVKKLETTS